MKKFISYADMDSKGIRRGRHNAIDMAFGKKAEVVNTWAGPGLLMGTIEVDGIDFDWFEKAYGFLFLTAE